PPCAQRFARVLRRGDRQGPQVRGSRHGRLALLAGRFTPALGGKPLGFFALCLFRGRLPCRFLFGGLLLGQPAGGLFLLALLVRLALALQLCPPLRLLLGRDLLADNSGRQLALAAIGALA